MENKEMDQQDQKPEGYTMRPMWQVWAARVGLVLFILFVAYEILQLAEVGL